MDCKFLYCLGAVASLLLTATNGFSFESYGANVNNACGEVIYSGDCALCHVGSKSAGTAAKDAYMAGQLVEFFCPPSPPPTPACTDNDKDTYAVEGGECGPADCNDNDAAINPGAAENCRDNLDNNCNDLVDDKDAAAVGCLVCTDSDGDGFNLEGGDCGPVDCDDTNFEVNPDAGEIPNNGMDEDCSGSDSVDPTLTDQDGDGYSQAGDCNDNNADINPGAVDIPNNGIDENCDGADSVDPSRLDNDGDGFTPAGGDCDDSDGEIHPDSLEVCGDSIDNDCDGLVDIHDPDGVDCPVTCVDNDADGYAVEGGECGPVDCSDADTTVNPGALEVCGDAIDNDCDTVVDEGCEVGCTDDDGDGYQDAGCGGIDCDDADAAVNPGAIEVCGNGVDENCNGESDDACLACPDGTLLSVSRMEYKHGDDKLRVYGRATVGNTVSVMDSGTDQILAQDTKVSKGKWVAEIEAGSRVPENITVVTSGGCEVDQAVNIGGSHKPRLPAGNGGGRKIRAEDDE